MDLSRDDNSLTGLRSGDLEKAVCGLGGKKYNAGQIWSWLYKKNVFDIDKMTDIPSALRISLKQNCSVSLPEIERSEKSADGTVKLLLKLFDSNYIECVIIPEKDRITLCVSSQAGCRFNCSFCATGKLGFKRNLYAYEIVGQVLTASDFINKRITNVVYMGMGEPFDNYDEVIKSADIISDDSGLAVGKRKITISTFGHVENIIRFTNEDVRYKLAVSLHNPFDSERNLIMPANRKYGIRKLFEALSGYTKKSNRKVVFEYVLLRNVNDSEKHAKELIKLLSALPSKLNLIKYHSQGTGAGFDQLEDESALKFYNFFKNQNFPVVFRSSRGEDISAACGQLTAKKNAGD